tara:strand:+ start:751 stop:915 length:165 start_codon:yes stop_codon:yes gene_type:complete
LGDISLKANSAIAQHAIGIVLQPIPEINIHLFAFMQQGWGVVVTEDYYVVTLVK